MLRLHVVCIGPDIAMLREYKSLSRLNWELEVAVTVELVVMCF